MTAPVDWSRWRKCRVCGAGIGEPCADLTYGWVTDDIGLTGRHPIDHPHHGRKQRTGGTS